MVSTERASGTSGSRLIQQPEGIKPRSSTACNIKLQTLGEPAYLLHVNVQVSRRY
mgnify:FL=1